MDPRLLEAVGVQADLPAAEKAAALVRSLPIRSTADIGQRDVNSAVESRWFAGPSECLRALSDLCRGVAHRGLAFGGSWPYLQVGGRLLAPALPVALSSTETTGPDGHYHISDGVVWREAVGERRPFLATDGARAAPDGAFDLLWFGGGERYLLRGGILDIEDLYSVTRIRATRQLVARLLLRALRVDSEVLDGLSFSDRAARTEVEVRRPRELLAGSGWRDPERVLAIRTDIQSVVRRGDQLIARTERDQVVQFNVVEEARGWRVYTWEGDYLYRTLALFQVNDVVSYSGTVDAEVDVLASGIRGRLAFDLRSDLVALDTSA